MGRQYEELKPCSGPIVIRFSVTIDTHFKALDEAEQVGFHLILDQLREVVTTRYRFAWDAIGFGRVESF